MSKSISFASAYFYWLKYILSRALVFFGVLAHLLPVFWGHSTSAVKKTEPHENQEVLLNPTNGPWGPTVQLDQLNILPPSCGWANPLAVPKEESEQGKDVFTPFHNPFYRFSLWKSKIQIPLMRVSQNAAAWHPCHTDSLTTITAKTTCNKDIQKLAFSRSNFIGFSYFVKCKTELQPTETTNAAQRGCTHCSQLCSRLWPASGRLLSVLHASGTISSRKCDWHIIKEGHQGRAAKV